MDISSTIANYDEINYRELAKKIDKLLEITNKEYLCRELINLLSVKKQMDLKLLTGYREQYGEAYAYIKKLKLFENKGRLTEYLVFTKKGLEEFIHDAHLCNYLHICRYFNISPRDKDREKLKKEVLKISKITTSPDDNDCKYDKTYTIYRSRMLQFIYGKRKTYSWMDEEFDVKKALFYLAKINVIDTIDKNRYEIIENHLNYLHKNM